MNVPSDSNAPVKDPAARYGLDFAAGLGLGWILISVAACIVALHVANGEAVGRYLKAPVCAAAATATATAEGPCLVKTSATVVSIGDVANPGGEVGLGIFGGVERIRPATVDDRSRLAELTVGDRLAVIGWEGTITEVGSGAGTVHTSSDPATGPLVDVYWPVAILGGLGVVLVLVTVGEPIARRVRRRSAHAQPKDGPEATLIGSGSSGDTTSAAPVEVISLNPYNPPAANVAPFEVISTTPTASAARPGAVEVPEPAIPPIYLGNEFTTLLS